MTDLGNLVEETQQMLGTIIQKVIARGVQGVKLETVYKRSTNSLDRLDRSLAVVSAHALLLHQLQTPVGT
jgi:hypothetical protein